MKRYLSKVHYIHSLMVCSVVINPSLHEDMLYKSAEEVCQFIASDKDSHLTTCSIENDSDYGTSIDFHHHNDEIGDTATIFVDKKGSVYKMTYIDFEKEHSQRPTYNLLASILHYQGKKIWGKVLVTRLIDNELCPCCPDDVLQVLYRRAWHNGLFIDKLQEPKEIEIDNRWIVRGTDECISEWHKKQVTDKSGRTLLKVWKSGHEDDRYYLFLLLDDVMMMDLYRDEYTGLSE